MLVTIRLFARLRELAGASELQRELPDASTAGGAWEAIAREFPPLVPHGATISCAVNEQYARLSTPLAEGDEVAFLPPVSGGAARAEVSRGEQEIKRSGAAWGLALLNEELLPPGLLFESPEPGTLVDSTHA